MNKDIPVHAAIPEGGYLYKPWDITNMDCWAIRDATGEIIDKLEPYHACRLCNGYIQGEPVEEHIDNIGILSGRKGIEYSCRRCGCVLHFVGMMA